MDTMRIKEARLSKTAVLEEYFSWLCDLVEADQGYRSYNLLLRVLHEKKFSWTVPNDDNRAHEGKNLREKFCEESNILYIYEYFSDDCSMLELLIALAYRCENIMEDQDGDIPMKEWFWKMISNVGLDDFPDQRWSHSNVEFVVEEKLDKIIKRRYERNGRGGLFPLKFSKKDQRKVELWYQMSSYLLENYYTEDLFL